MAQFNRPCREEERKGERGREGKRHLSLHCVMRSEVDHLRLEGFVVAEASFGGKYLTICPPTSAHTLTHTHTHTHTTDTETHTPTHTDTHIWPVMGIQKSSTDHTQRGMQVILKWKMVPECMYMCTCVCVYVE